MTIPLSLSFPPFGITPTRSIRRIHQLPQLPLIHIQLSQANHVNKHIVLLQLLPRLHQRLLIGIIQRRSNKEHNPLRAILIPPMLQRQGRHLNRSRDIHRVFGGRRDPPSRQRNLVQRTQDFPQIVRRTDQQFRSGTAAGRRSGGGYHGDDSHGGFGIRLGFLGDNHVGGVGLGFHAGGEVVAVAHVLGVVEKDHAGFEGHFGCIFLF
mmetsp:Transcript_10398/g.22257  ORF Transcript_10398/g.22257 Transcript_10398/m.22257 type:complete len:208 (+) Transcript_10398:1052-1675(+)